MKKKLTLLIIAIVFVEIVEIVIAVFFVKNRIFTALFNEFNKRRLIILKTTAKAISEDVSDIVNKLKIISDLPEVRQKEEVCNQKLNEVYHYFNNKIDNLVRLDKNAVINCAYNKKTIGINLDKEANHFKIIYNDRTHPPVMGRKRVSPATGREVVGIHVPLFYNNQFNGILGSAIYTNRLGKNYLSLIVNSFYKNNVYLIDDNFDILYYREFFNIEKDFLNKTLKQIVTGKEKNYCFDKKEYNFIYTPVNVFSKRRWYLVDVISYKDITNRMETETSYKNDIKTSFLLILAILLSLITGTLVILFYLNKKER